MVWEKHWEKRKGKEVDFLCSSARADVGGGFPSLLARADAATLRYFGGKLSLACLYIEHTQRY